MRHPGLDIFQTTTSHKGHGLELSLLQIFLSYDKKMCGIPGNAIYLDYHGEWNVKHHPQKLQLNPESDGNIKFSEFG